MSLHLGTAPLSAVDLERLRATVAKTWPEHAQAQGLRDPMSPWYGMVVRPAKAPAVRLQALWSAGYRRALEGLARALEDDGYAIERRGAARIVAGWATVGGAEVRALPPWHPDRAAYGELLFTERLDRDRPRHEAMSHPRGPKYEGEVRRSKAAGGHER